MSYCTAQDLIDRFGEAEIIQRTDRDNLGGIDYAVLDRAIADADAEINGYLTAYPLPLTAVPANLVRIACDVTRYYLYDDQTVEPIEARYNAGIKYLMQVAKGQISLGPDVAGTVDATTEDGVAYQAQSSVFGSDALSGF